MMRARRQWNPRGTILVVAVLLLTLLTTLGMGLLTSSLNENVVALNDVNSQRALGVAEAGIAHARRMIAVNLSSTSLTSRLTGATSGSPEVALSNFSSVAGLGTGKGTYSVWISNNLTAYNKSPGYAADAAAATDTDRKVWLRSEGTYKNSTRTVRVFLDFTSVLDPPGAITLIDGALPVIAQPPGQPINQSTDFDGNAFSITGVDTPAPTTAGACGTTSGAKYGISANSDTSKTALATALDDNQEVRVQGTGNLEGTSSSGSYANNGTISSATLQSVATNLLPSATAITGSPNSGDFGTAAVPGVYKVDGNVVLNGNGKGYGVLVVTGDFEMSGNYKWEGLIIVVGTGSVSITGADSKVFGGILAANTQPGGRTSLDVSGNGGAYFSSQAICRVQNMVPSSTVVAWQQLG